MNYIEEGGHDQHLIETRREQNCGPQTYLIIFRGQLVQAFLNNVVSVQVLNQDNDMQAERKDYRMDDG